ncbi:DUF6950 family protein [Paracoccus contaminans]|uniref:DUF6950 domain-containing protein n=1 Tax=Paracoccus contaminans TaxID=1945662 RepID=A0A1W6CYZ7_9RHOB|nr:hypothetical protein [Paracoccus contaminans]ARJ70082.1 hypothetical protein B0A89_11000 [Paracoccus contaminans]
MRLYNWEARLSSYLARASREQFAWGRHDCALFAAGGVEAVTGHDPAAKWRGRYGTRAEGLRLMRAAGFVDHIDAAVQSHPPVPRGQAMPADLAIVQTDDDRALGIVQGELVYVLPASGRGLGLVSIDRAGTILGVR